MSYIVYHESFTPELLKEEQDYFEYLATGEWFDRPQINEKGNRNETERLLNEFKERIKSGQYGLSEPERKILQYSDDQERNTEEWRKSKNDRGPESANTQVVKRRGRPKLNR